MIYFFFHSVQKKVGRPSAPYRLPEGTGHMTDPVLGLMKEGGGGRADGEVAAADEEAAYRHQRKRNCDICLHVDKRDRGGGERQS